MFVLISAKSEWPEAKRGLDEVRPPRIDRVCNTPLVDGSGCGCEPAAPTAAVNPQHRPQREDRPGSAPAGRGAELVEASLGRGAAIRREESGGWRRSPPRTGARGGDVEAVQAVEEPPSPAALRQRSRWPSLLGALERHGRAVGGRSRRRPRGVRAGRSRRREASAPTCSRRTSTATSTGWLSRGMWGQGKQLVADDPCVGARRRRRRRGWSHGGSRPHRVLAVGPRGEASGRARPPASAAGRRVARPGGTATFDTITFAAPSRRHSRIRRRGGVGHRELVVDGAGVPEP